MQRNSKVEQLLGGEGRKILLYHQDGDGVTSAAIALKAYPNLEPHAREGPQVDAAFSKWLVAKKPAVIVFFDLPVDQEWKKVQLIAKKIKGVRIIILDHHVVEKNLNSKNIIHLNPRFGQPKIYQPTAYLAYKLFAHKREVKKAIWIAAVGTISDHAFDDTKDVLDACAKQYPGMLDGGVDSKMGEAAKLISAAITLKGTDGAKLALKELANSKGFYEFIETARLRKMYEAVRTEIDKVLADFDKRKETDHKLGTVTFEAESRMNILSVIASILARKFPEHIIVLRKKSSKGWKVSARWQTASFNLGAAIKHAAHGLGLGGGHEKAAGALVSDWNQFWGRLKQQISKHR